VYGIINQENTYSFSFKKQSQNPIACQRQKNQLAWFNAFNMVLIFIYKINNVPSGNTIKRGVSQLV
jgi:hypothetical protein